MQLRVLLLNPRLPGMDGFEMAQRLPHTPVQGVGLVVALSGSGAPEDVRQVPGGGNELPLS